MKTGGSCRTGRRRQHRGEPAKTDVERRSGSRTATDVENRLRFYNNGASAIPGVIVTPDVGGRIAARLGAKTSGHVLVYDENGVLKFSGGITAARGH